MENKSFFEQVKTDVARCVRRNFKLAMGKPLALDDLSEIQAGDYRAEINTDNSTWRVSAVAGIKVLEAPFSSSSDLFDNTPLPVQYWENRKPLEGLERVSLQAAADFLDRAGGTDTSHNGATTVKAILRAEQRRAAKAQANG